MSKPQNIVRIGVFYDGAYLVEIGKYYRYYHPRKEWLDMGGLHAFIQRDVAGRWEVEERFCRIVEAHFFRGRYYAKDCSDEQLRRDRVFDDTLMQQDITTHYAPLRRVGDGFQECGIDVWLALEAVELASRKQFDALVLVTADGDHVPLLRKLTALGLQVTLLVWAFDYTYEQDGKIVYKETRVSQRLIEEATHVVRMHEEMGALSQDAADKLFYKSNREGSDAENVENGQRLEDAVPPVSRQEGRILSLHNGYGFLEKEPHNVFFYHENVQNLPFSSLKVGDFVTYLPSYNERGEDIALQVEKI